MLKAIHICNSHQPTDKPKITKEYVFAKANRKTSIRLKSNIMKEHRTHNSTYKKLAVQWLNEALCLVSSSVVADSFRLRIANFL